MDRSVIIEHGRLVGVRFFLPQGEVSLARALRLIFEPDADIDEQDGLLMLSELARLGRLSDSDRDLLQTRLRAEGIPLLPLHRRFCWGSQSPPPDHFWWFRPKEWAQPGSA